MEPRLYQELVEVLQPFFQDEEQRTALVYEALRDSRSLQTLSFDGSATTFTLQLLNTLIHHDGEFSGYASIVAILQVVQSQADDADAPRYQTLIERLQANDLGGDIDAFVSHQKPGLRIPSMLPALVILSLLILILVIMQLTSGFAIEPFLIASSMVAAIILLATENYTKARG